MFCANNRIKTKQLCKKDITVIRYNCYNIFVVSCKMLFLKGFLKTHTFAYRLQGHMLKKLYFNSDQLHNNNNGTSEALTEILIK